MNDVKKDKKGISRKGAVAIGAFLLVLSVLIIASHFLITDTPSIRAQTNTCTAECSHKSEYPDIYCTMDSECILIENDCDADYTPSMWVVNPPSFDCACSCVYTGNPPGGSCSDQCPKPTPNLDIYAYCVGENLIYPNDSLCEASRECRYNRYACNGKGMRCVYSFFGGGFQEYRWVNSLNSEDSSAGDCSDGHDNDCDGLIDEEDPDCNPNNPTVNHTCDEPPGCTDNTGDQQFEVSFTTDTGGDTGDAIKEFRYCPALESYTDIPAADESDTSETAVYDPNFGAPSCITGASPCIASSSLLMSRDGGDFGAYGQPGEFLNWPPFVPSEPNQPNTIDSCYDMGFESDTFMRSNIRIENITISVAGNIIIGGDTLSYSVWAYCNNTAWDTVSISYTDDASSPSWTSMQNHTCQAEGAQEFTGSFTLNSLNQNHAIRASITDDNNPSDYFCPTYNMLQSDVDDLVFYVAPSMGDCTPVYKRDAPYSWDHINNQDVTVRYQVWDLARNTDTGSYRSIIGAPPATPTPPFFIVRNGVTNVAKIGSNGAMEVSGTSSEGVGSITPSGNDDFVIKNPSGTNVAMIDGTGNLYLLGSLNTNVDQSTLNNALSGNDNFIITELGGNVIAYFDSSGNLYLKGGFIPSGSP